MPFCMFDPFHAATDFARFHRTEPEPFSEPPSGTIAPPVRTLFVSAIRGSKQSRPKGQSRIEVGKIRAILNSIPLAHADHHFSGEVLLTSTGSTIFGTFRAFIHSIKTHLESSFLKENGKCERSIQSKFEHGRLMKWTQRRNQKARLKIDQLTGPKTLEAAATDPGAGGAARRRVRRGAGRSRQRGAMTTVGGQRGCMYREI